MSVGIAGSFGATGKRGNLAGSFWFPCSRRSNQPFPLPKARRCRAIVKNKFTYCIEAKKSRKSLTRSNEIQRAMGTLPQRCRAGLFQRCKSFKHPHPPIENCLCKSSACTFISAKRVKRVTTIATTIVVTEGRECWAAWETLRGRSFIASVIFSLRGLAWKNSFVAFTGVLPARPTSSGFETGFQSPFAGQTLSQKLHCSVPPPLKNEDQIDRACGPYTLASLLNT